MSADPNKIPVTTRWVQFPLNSTSGDALVQNNPKEKAFQGLTLSGDTTNIWDNPGWFTAHSGGNFCEVGYSDGSSDSFCRLDDIDGTGHFLVMYDLYVPSGGAATAVYEVVVTWPGRVNVDQPGWASYILWGGTSVTTHYPMILNEGGTKMICGVGLTDNKSSPTPIWDTRVSCAFSIDCIEHGLHNYVNGAVGGYERNGIWRNDKHFGFDHDGTLPNPNMAVSRGLGIFGTPAGAPGFPLDKVGINGVATRVSNLIMVKFTKDARAWIPKIVEEHWVTQGTLPKSLELT